MQTASHLFACDHHSSVLRSAAHVRSRLAYTPFGFNALGDPLLKFNGQCSEHLGREYFLGNGYRAYSTVLMRFNSPDSWSPFGEGGLNVYAYCLAEPINQVDPTGHLTQLKVVARGVPPATEGRFLDLGARIRPLFAPVRGRRLVFSRVDELASHVGDQTMFDTLIMRSNDIVSLRLGHLADASLIAPTVSARRIDFANILFAEKKTPAGLLIDLAERGTPYQRRKANRLLDEIFSGGYATHSAQDKEAIVGGVWRRARTGGYSDEWLQANTIRSA